MTATEKCSPSLPFPLYVFGCKIPTGEARSPIGSPVSAMTQRQRSKEANWDWKCQQPKIEQAEGYPFLVVVE